MIQAHCLVLRRTSVEKCVKGTKVASKNVPKVVAGSYLWVMYRAALWAILCWRVFIDEGDGKDSIKGKE